MKNNQPEFEVCGKLYTCGELHDAVALCYSMIVKHGNDPCCKLRQSVYDFYNEAKRKYGNVLKTRLD